VVQREGPTQYDLSDGLALIDQFFARLMELRPVEATSLGLHEHDRRWPDGSLAGAEELRTLLRRFESDLAKAPGGLDRDLARYYAALTRFRLEDIRLPARMPEAPDQIGTGLFLLFARAYAPVDERLDTIAARLEAVPAYLATSREQLVEPVRLWCEVGMATARQLPELFSTVVAAAPAEPLHGRLERAAAEASQAAEEFARWLEADAMPRASGDWALGEERFERLIGLRELPDPVDAIRALARGTLEQVRDERRQLVSTCWPGRSVEEVDAVIRSQHPPTFEAALDEYRAVIGASREFVANRHLATLPDSEELRVEPTPGFLRGVIPFAAYVPPARFDPRQFGIYLVTPRGGDLGEHNHAAIRNTSVHEGYPGHHLQFACANQHASLARLLSAECAHELVEGWAHYCEQLMYEQGFTASPEVRFVQLNDLVWGACRVVIDVDLSSGRMTFQQAVDMLVGEAAMTRAGAEAEVRRYTYTPGYQLSYLYGKHLLLQLRQRRRRREGDAFDLRRFHDRLLYAGPVPAATWDALF
jgi:uncharacterized protein (DUF885 family)